MTPHHGDMDQEALRPRPTAQASRAGAGEQRECEACGELLIFARTKDGNVAPITKHVKGNGNVLLFKTEDGVVECRTVAGETLEKLKSIGVPRRLNHFADCPKADRFR